MQATLERLFRDHEQMRAVLDLIDPVQNDEAEIDEDRLACILDFLCEYPHWVHHPIEEAMFDRINTDAISAADRRALESVKTQHASMERQTNALFEQLEEQDLPWRELRRALALYIEAQLTHMAFEERVVFPLARKALDDKDWNELDTFYAGDRDPLFQAAQRRYKALYPHLVAEGNDGSFGASSVLRFLDAT